MNMNIPKPKTKLTQKEWDWWHNYVTRLKARRPDLTAVCDRFLAELALMDRI